MPKAAAILAVGYGLGDATASLTSLAAQIGESLLTNAGRWGCAVCHRSRANATVPTVRA